MSENQNDTQRRSNDDFHFEILEHLAVLSTRDNGWTREVNIVSWNSGAAKVDLRDWDPDHKRMSKGLTYFDDEAKKLTNALNKRYGLKEPRKDEPGSEPQPAAPAAVPPAASSSAAAPAPA